MGFEREETRRARKRHRCFGCGQSIEPGEQYLYLAGHDTDGEFGTWKYHPECREWEIHLCREAGLRYDEWSTLAEWVDEDRASLDGAPESVIARFPVEAEA
jgi:hypothetical protein